MKIVVLGDADDTAGFGLAGVEARVCRERRDLQAAVGDLQRRTDGVGLLLLTASVANLDPVLIERLLRDPQAPAVLVLPDPREET